ncbi:MAG: transcription antitermination factor NusB [Desulfamplus sp.]|nr:transcription antitermination factor NusB [Desulfamplus sp.]
MLYRRDARELALQALFYVDLNKGDPDKLFELFCIDFEDMINGALLNFDEMTSKDYHNSNERPTEDQKSFFMNLVQGVLRNIEEFDDLIHANSKNWKISRMNVVDRNIMRIALYELLYCSDIPAKVSINEAVEIGKKYGTNESGSFINGILDRIKELKNIE